MNTMNHPQPVPLTPAQFELLARVNRAQLLGLPHIAAALLALYQRAYGLPTVSPAPQPRPMPLAA